MTMAKEYIQKTTNRAARPRSRRLRELGGTTSGTAVSVIQNGGANPVVSGDGHTHKNLPYLDQITTDNDGYISLTHPKENEEDGSVSTVTEKAKAGYSDESGHSLESDHSKDSEKWSGRMFGDYIDQPVRKKDIVEFARVIAGIIGSPDFVQGIETGSGWKIDSDGSAEMSSLTLRSFLKVPQLIYNKVRVTGGEMWNTEGGTIAKVTADERSESAYILTMQVEDGDVIELDVDDICKGHYNSSGGFVTSYFRVTSVDQAAKTVRIVLGADDAVPGGKNAAPVPYMNIARYGNFTQAERQRSQYFSSTEQRIALLDGVDQYIILPSHFKLIIGSIPDSLIPKSLPLGKRPSIYLDTVLARNFMQLDGTGAVVKTIRDRGLWQGTPDTPYLCNDEFQDEVYHKSCKYRCIVEGTLQEPRYDSSDWLLVAGDTTLELIIDSTAGETFLYGCLDTTLMAIVRRGVNDITDEILDSDWTWSRDTGDAAADGVWNADHSGCGRSVDLTQEDLPVSSGRFICRAYVRDGAESVEAEVVF
jgi:hypothetical protein